MFSILIPKRSFRTSLLAGTAVGLAFLSAGRSASAQSATNSATIELPTLSVEGAAQNDYRSDQASLHKLTAPLLDTPQSVDVIPQQLIQDQGVTTLRDTLRNVAGISLAAGEAGAQGDNLTLRGFSARNDIFLDGMRDFGSYYRDAFNYDSVEVLQGPSSILFGRGSTGGVINQVSKVPTLTPHNEISVTAGTQPSV